MHCAKNHQNSSHFTAQQLQSSLGIDRFSPVFHGQSDESNINQVEPNYQKMVHRGCQRLISCEAVDQKNSAILMKGPGDPDGEQHADYQVSDISPKSRIEGGSFNKGHECFHN